jgi:hypothetical protein
MKNIHILPTDKPSKKGDVVVWNGLKIWDGIGEPPHHNQNIYITNDEEIKEGDWIYSVVDNKIYRIVYSKNNIIQSFFHSHYLNESKKIILTTDQDLIADGVQAIDDNFLEWFVRNPSCEKVEVEHFGTCCGNQSITQCINCKKYNPVYKIIIPQEEPKQEIELIDGFIPTSFFNKQETLEEAAGKLYPLTGEVGIDHRNYLRKEGFINGAKYQAERMYTLEQISKDFIGEEGQSGYFDDWLDYRLDTGNKLSFKEWFEQFKNK